MSLTEDQDLERVESSIKQGCVERVTRLTHSLEDNNQKGKETKNLHVFFILYSVANLIVISVMLYVSILN